MMTMSHTLQHVKQLTASALRSEAARLVAVTREHTAELIEEDRTVFGEPDVGS